MGKMTHRHKHPHRLPPSMSSTSDEPSYEEEDGFSLPVSEQQMDEEEEEDEDADDEYDHSRTEVSKSSYSGFDPSSPTGAEEPSVKSSISPALPHPPPPTYINVAPLPVFRGSPGECPVAHLGRFARVCRANNASTEDMVVRIFPVTLDDEAALWYELDVEPNPSLTWEEIKSAFLQAYRRSDQSRSELMSLRQGEAEGVNAFYLRLHWILKKWPEHGIPDEMLRGIFVDGLREDYQDWIIPQRPNSLVEAFRLALSWEQAESIRSARRRNAVVVGEGVKCGFCDGFHEESSCEVRRKLRELWLRSKEDGLFRVPSLPKAGGGGGETLSRSGSLIRRQGGEEEGEEEGERVGGVSSSRRSQCLCWKHQCWKKFERSTSAPMDRNGNAAAPE